MALSYVALLPIPLLCPSVQLSIGVPAISLEASLTGALALNASLTVSPPTVQIYLDALIEIQAQLDLGISLGVPSASFDLSDTLSLIASLELAFSLLVELEAILSASIGMYAFTYSGVASNFGAAVTTELATVWPDGAPTASTTEALIFGAVSPIAQTQIAAFLNGLEVGTGLVYTAKMSAMSELSLVTNLATGQGNAAISAQLAAAVSLKASASLTPPTLAVTAEALAKFAANLRAQLSIAPPKVSAAISATANLAASISAKFNFIVALGACLNRYDAELFVYSYAGAGDAMGAALTSSLATTWGDGTTPTSGECLAVMLAATDSVSFGVMSSFFGGA